VRFEAHCAPGSDPECGLRKSCDATSARRSLGLTGRIDVPPFDRSMSTALPCARGPCGGRLRVATLGRLALTAKPFHCGSHRPLQVAAGTANADRDRRSDPAAALTPVVQVPSIPTVRPRRSMFLRAVSRAVRLVARLRHRARRSAAARRSRNHRLARDRMLRGLRHRRV